MTNEQCDKEKCSLTDTSCMSTSSSCISDVSDDDEDDIHSKFSYISKNGSLDSDNTEFNLPASSQDLLVPNECVMDCLGLYEILRRFSNVLRLSRFLFEDFCSCLLSEDASVMLCEIHITLLKAIHRDNEENGVCFVHNDLKSSFDILLFATDHITWPSVMKMYLSANFAPVEILNIFHEGFPFVDFKKRICVLRYLTDYFLTISSVRRSLSLENVQEQNYDDHCRVCHKRGDLLCCDGCTATFHMYCLTPPLDSVPKEQWYCPVCVKSKVHGVTDCGIFANDSKSLRLELLGYDRCYRTYWFLCRRIFVESENSDLWYYSTKAQYYQLIDVLEKTGHKCDLLSVFRSFENEILREMAITIELTDERKSGKQSYFDIQQMFCENVPNENDDFDEVFEDAETLLKEDKNDEALIDDSDLCFFSTDDPFLTSDKFLKNQTDGVNDESPPVIKVLNLNPGNGQEPVLSTFNLQWLLNQSNPSDVSAKNNSLDFGSLLITSTEQCDNTNALGADSLFSNTNMIMGEQRLVYDEPVQMNMCTPLSHSSSRKDELRTERQSSGVRVYTLSALPQTSTPVISKVPSNLSNTRTSNGLENRSPECNQNNDSVDDDVSTSSETTDSDKSLFDFAPTFANNAIIPPKKVFVPLTHPLAEESIKKSRATRGKRRGRPPLTYKNITVKTPEDDERGFIDDEQFATIESPRITHRGRGRGRPSTKRGSRRARCRIPLNFNDRRSTRSSTGSLKPRIFEDSVDDTLKFIHPNTLPNSLESMDTATENEEFETVDFSFNCPSTSAAENEADQLLDLDFSKSFLKLLKFLRVKPPSDENEEHKSLYDFYVLGDDPSFKQYRNTFTNNPLAVPKSVISYERERKNILARRYTVNSDMEFVWKLPITGSLTSYIQNIRLSLLNFECCIPTPFMHSLWHSERLKWANEVLNCLDPEHFGILLLKLEAAVKPFIFNPSYFDGIAAVAWRRETQQEREDKRKDDQQNKKRIDVEIASCTYIPKMTRPCLWRMKGEEYRILGGGWIWIRSTRKYLLRDKYVKHLSLTEQWPLLTRLNITTILSLLRRRCVVSEMLDPVTGKLSCIKFNNDGESCYEVTETDLLDVNRVFKGVHPLLEQIDTPTIDVEKALSERTLYPKRAAIALLDNLLSKRTALQTSLKSQMDASLLSLRERVKQDLFSTQNGNGFSSHTDAEVELKAEETMHALVESGHRESDGTVVVKYKNDSFKIRFNIDDTRLPFNLSKFHCTKKKQMNAQLPPYMSFESNKKKNFFILPSYIAKKLAKKAGDIEVPGFKDSRHIVWPFPCGKPVQRTVWCWRTRTANTLSAIALQTKLLWLSIRWDALCKRDVMKTHFTEIVKRRDIGRFGLKSEYLIKKSTQSDCGRNKPGLSFSSKEEWVDEAALEPLDIFHFYEQEQRKLRCSRNKHKQTTLSQHVFHQPVMEDPDISKEKELGFKKSLESCQKIKIPTSLGQLLPMQNTIQNVVQSQTAHTQASMVSIESNVSKLISSPTISTLSNVTLVSAISDSPFTSPTVQPPIYKVLQNTNGKLPKVENAGHFEPRVLRLVDGRLTCVRNISSNSSLNSLSTNESVSEKFPNNIVSVAKVVQNLDSHVPTYTKVVVEQIDKSSSDASKQSVVTEKKTLEDSLSQPTEKGLDSLQYQLESLNQKLIKDAAIVRSRSRQSPRKLKNDENKLKSENSRFLTRKSESVYEKSASKIKSSLSLHQRFSTRRKVDRDELKLMGVCTSIINGIVLEVDRMEKKMRRAKNRLKKSEHLPSSSLSIEQSLKEHNLVNEKNEHISKRDVLRIRMNRIQAEMIKTLKISEEMAKESCKKVQSEIPSSCEPQFSKRRSESSSPSAPCKVSKRSPIIFKSTRSESVSESRPSHSLSLNRPVRKRKSRRVSFSPDPFNNRASNKRAKKSRLKHVNLNKSSGRHIKKPKWLSGSERRKPKFNPENSDLLFCTCKTPYDEKQLYVGCDQCGNWFHLKCIGISANMAQEIEKYTCIECTKKTDSERVYCLCKAPYDETQFYVGCDKCQEWFHGSCVGVTPEEAENMKKYFCPRCCNEGGNVLDAPLSRKQWDLVKDLFRALKGHQMAWPFMAPVSVKDFPLYYSIIPDPMDLSTLEGRLMRGSYKNLGEFVRDTTKIFDNCRMFNSVDSIFWQCADALEHFFVGLLNKLKATLLQQIKECTT